MKYYRIECHTSVECRSKAEALGLLVLLERMGEPIHDRAINDDDFDEYPNVVWSLNEVSRTRATPKSDPDRNWVTINEFIALFDPANQPEQLPEVYGETPVIRDGGKTLKVGCQKIPFETVETIYKAMKKALR